jgi:serine/threonine-protein kinase
MKDAADFHRWAEALSAFDAIVELSGPRREARLAGIGAGDPDLRRAVEALLAADSAADVRLGHLDAVLPSADSSQRDHRAARDPLGLAGRTVSHFRVIESLAQGGMGIVYRAEDTRLARPVALKFPLAAGHLDARTKERFLHESRLAGALDHPNVCSIYEAGETDEGYLFHAMPLYSGETLKARIARDGTLPVAAAIAIARQIAHGLSAAHRAGIVHRDLKPANVMLLPDETVKIVDFGLARAKDLDLTTSRAALGTVSYMAPEQIVGDPVDGRADLWALGTILYEMVTGRRPFEGDEAVAIAHAIVRTEPVRLSERRSDIPGGVERVVHTLLSKEASGRYQSAEDVIAALAAIDLQPDAPTAIPRRAMTSGPTRRRWSSRLVAIAATSTAVGVAGWLASRGAPREAEPRSIAVLPFDDLGGGPSDRHLAVGLSDAIGTNLSRLRGVIVPGYPSSPLVRTSSSKPPPAIATDLGASAVITGTVRRVDGRLRVEVHVFDAWANKRVGSQRYERALSDLAGIPNEATRAALAALEVDVTPAERESLERPPTSNARAYDAYLRGRAVELEDASPGTRGRTAIENLRLAQSFYSRARDLDPSFAAARARLAYVLMRGALTYDTTPARREQARLEAEAALRLKPRLMEAHAALALYWSSSGKDMPKAVDALERAIDGSPNRADLHLWLGNAYVVAGRWDEAVAAYERAARVDPGDPTPPTRAAFTYLRMRRDEDAMRAFDRAIALTPDNRMLRVIKGHTYLRWRGTVDTLAAVLRSVPADWDPDGMTTWARYTVLRVQRRYAEGLAMLDSSRSALSRDGLVYQPTALMRAQCYEALGDAVKARSHYEAARAMLADSVRAHPNDASIRVVLGLAHASLGRPQDAVREARRAMELAPLSENSPGATAFMGVAVEVFGRVGELDAAFELVELLLAMPAGREVTIPFLRLWPGFDPLRNDPRFEQLINRFTVS